MYKRILFPVAAICAIICSTAIASENESDHPDLKSGIWVVMCCPEQECEEDAQIIDIMDVCQQAFPEFGFASTTKLPEEIATSEVIFDVDPSGYYRRFYAVEQQQSLVVIAQGLGIKRLQWPFTLGEALKAIAQASLIAMTVPERVDLTGMEAPNFFATDQLGRHLSLANLEFPVLLAFMNTSCPGCHASVPALCSMKERMRVHLLISGDEKEGFDALLRDPECSYLIPWFIDNSDFLFNYSLRWVPSYVYIDETGIVAGIHEGSADEEDLLALIGEIAVHP